MKAISFLPAAREDIRREKSYYRKINPELARQFQAAVETAANGAAENPQAMQVLENEIRRWPLTTFPHGLLYRDEPDSVLVLAVFHPSQSPARWQGRSRT